MSTTLTTNRNVRFPTFRVFVRMFDDIVRESVKRGRWSDGDPTAAELSVGDLITQREPTPVGYASARIVVDSDPRQLRGHLEISRWNHDQLDPKEARECMLEIELLTPQIGGPEIANVSGLATIKMTSDNDGGMATTKTGVIELLMDDKSVLALIPALRLGSTGSGDQATSQARSRHFTTPVLPPSKIGIRSSVCLTPGETANVDFVVNLEKA